MGIYVCIACCHPQTLTAATRLLVAAVFSLGHTELGTRHRQGGADSHHGAALPMRPDTLPDRQSGLHLQS